MTTATTRTSRCDRILALIDDCLADAGDVNAPVPGAPSTTTPTRVAHRRLALVRS